MPPLRSTSLHLLEKWGVSILLCRIVTFSVLNMASQKLCPVSKNVPKAVLYFMVGLHCLYISGLCLHRQRSRGAKPRHHHQRGSLGVPDREQTLRSHRLPRTRGFHQKHDHRSITGISCLFLTNTYVIDLPSQAFKIEMFNDVQMAHHSKTNNATKVKVR